MTHHLLKLALPSESAWLTLYREHFAVERDGQWQPRPGVEAIILGTLYRETGQMVTGPGGDMQVPERVPTNGLFHVDLIAPDVPEAVYPYLVNPVVTKHVWYGAEVVSLPEALVEAETTEMVTRGIGQAVPDDVLARLDRAVLMGRITPEMAADRRAWIEAGIAIAEAREAVGEARTARGQAVAQAQAAAAERTRILALREAELAKRQAAVDALVGKVGAARTPFIAARDAATAEASRLADAAAAKASELDVARKARDDAAAELQAAATAIAAARAQRDVIKAAIK
ncbi:MAG: hypothetical protein ACOYLL_14410 [Beijerinckiaceae bacterium]